MLKIYKSGDGKLYNYGEMISLIATYIKNDITSDYEITIGTDSQSHINTKIVEVFAIRRIGKGGIFFYKTETVNNFLTLRDKIYEETNRSLRNARGFMDSVSNELFSYSPPIFLDELNVQFKIHCDVGHNGATESLIKEIVSWVHAMGYEVAIKPESYTSSGIADKFSK